MGMYDSVIVYMTCPKCQRWGSFDFQTKDLACFMDTYHPLDKDWGTAKFQKEFREGLPVFRKFPFDKEQNVWANQAERTEAQATLEAPYDTQLKFISVYTSCGKCKAWIEGTIAVIDGKLKLPFNLTSEVESEIPLNPD